MTSRTSKTPLEKFSVEVRAVRDRGIEESDLEDVEMAEAAAKVISDWLDEEVLTFEPDDDMLGDG